MRYSVFKGVSILKNNKKIINSVIITISIGLLFFILTTCEGQMGPMGPQGVQGEQGSKGDQGIQGEQGSKGDKGDQGNQGNQGNQGIQGEQGSKGDKGDQPTFIIERVSFTSLTANGDADTTTTRLTLNFSADITGLSSADITIIDLENTGAAVGPLTRTGEGTYSMIVFGINAPGAVSVVVSNNRYIFSPVYHSVDVFYDANMSPTFTNIEDMASWLLSVPDNNQYDEPYHIGLSGLNLETDLMINTDPLRKLFDALHRYVVIDLRGCTGGFISNVVSGALVNSRPNKERLVSILLPDSLTSIGDFVFYYFYGLTSISLPASLTAISNSAFSRCQNLSFSVYGSGSLSTSDGIVLILNTTVIAAPGASGSITVPEGITAIGDSAFDYCYNLTSISLPASLTTIGDSAFAYCNKLTSISLPASLTTIGDSAFAFCTTLTSIGLPASLTTIGDSAFRYCTSLTSINLPASLTTIGSLAFYYCSSLILVTSNAASPPEASDSIFADTPTNYAIKVPAGSVAAYKAAPGWSAYASRISAIE